MTPAELKAEIETGPLVATLAPLVTAGNDAGVAAALNAINTAVDRTTVASHLVFECIVPAEWAALTAAEKQRIQTILGMGEINLKGTNTRASLAAAFGAGTATRTALLALQSRPGSRAEQVWGAGTIISPSDVSLALRGRS